MDMAQLLAEAEPIRNLRRGEVVMGEVMRVDAEGILQYKQIVSDITNEPNYDEVLEAVKKL